MQVLRAYFIALLVALFAIPAAAQEVIRSFETAIAVATDASVAITETITVNAEGNAIQRGIFRDVPTVLTGPRGQDIRSDLAVISVTRNGNPEPYAVENISNGKRIRIGSADTLLDRGAHTYQIRYSMDRAARMFDGHDELYWNATGNFWQFPIQRATALVTLPEGANITDLAAFTGAYGVASADNSIERLSDREARFTVTRTLQPYEGLTVAVAFEKGVLAAPEGAEAVQYWLSDNRDYVVPGILLALVLLYNSIAWFRVGRDPAKGVIIPRFYPPQGFSPALTHYVHNMGWQKNGWAAFSAALVSLATKGLVEIEKNKRKTTLSLTGKQPDEPLPPGERVIFTHLQSAAPVTIDKKTGPALDKKRSEFLSALETENRKVYFRRNTVYIVGGILLAAASIAIMFALGVANPVVLFFGILAAILLSVFTLVLRLLWQGPALGKFIGLGIAGIIGFNVAIAFTDALSIPPVGFPATAAVSIVLITLVFSILMRAPTVHGRAVMDEIDGFKMYLETAEKERLNFQNEPEMSVSRFEAILPYAMALGVEKPWSQRFENDLARHAVRDADTGYTPHWYHGSSFSGSRIAASMAGIGAGLSSSMASAQPSSTSSSGFSGGGFSGGGGGGGGGGGW